MPVMQANNYTRAEELLPELTAAYQGGESINSISTRLELRREAVATVLMTAGVAPSTTGRDKLLAYVRENSGLSVEDLAFQLEMPKSTVSRYLRGTPEQKSVVTRKKTDYTTFSDADKVAALKEAWKLLDKDQKSKGLSRVRYDRLLGHRKDRPSSTTFIRRYGTWSAACEEAGIKAAAARRSTYPQEFSNEDILDGIARYIAETNKTSFHGYASWAKDNGCASGPLVVIRHGSWSEARRRSLLRQADAVADETEKRRLRNEARRLARSRKKS